jgi:hypothetical protein
MAVPVPLSPLFVLLILALPAVWLLGRALAHAITTDLGLRAVLPFGIGLSLWVLSLHVASLVAGSFLVGLPVGTLVPAALGIAAELRRRRLPPGATTGRRPSAFMGFTMVAATMILAPAALRFSFHDELYITGHMSIAAEIQNGIYPPRHLTFPDLPLRYHYGFDLLVATLTGLFRLGIDRAIDAATLGLWAITWCLLWILGERLVGRSRAWLTPLLTLFGAGIPVGCPHVGPSIVANVVAECNVATHPINAPVISYFFQHPWSLGIPVALTAILLYTERSPVSARARLAVIGLVLSALSMSEIVLFTGLLPALVVAEAWYEDRLELRRVPGMLLVVVASVVVARMLGGFFVRSPELPALQFTLHAGFADVWKDTPRWNFKSFGLLLPLGVAGIAVLRPARLLFFLLFAGSFLVLNGLRYGGSADIMKFGTLAAIALAVLGSAALGRLIPSPAGARPWRAALAAALLFPATAAGFLFAFIYTLDLAEIPGAYRKKADVLAPVDVLVVSWLRARVRPGDLIYRGSVATHGYAQWGGLPQPPITWTTKAFGFPPAKVAEREQLIKDPPSDIGAYRRQGFRFLVLDGTPEDVLLSRRADAWIAARTARPAANFGLLRVVEILP